MAHESLFTDCLNARSPRSLAPSVVLAWIVLFLAAGCTDREPRNTGIRIVLITLDTLRYDSLAGSAERPTTMPELAAWAESATVFERFFSASASTQPSHASMFTGLHPWQHGMSRNGMKLAESHETVAEALRSAGFETAAVVASFPVSGRFGFDQGFEHYDDLFEAGHLRSGEWLKAARRIDEGAEAGDGAAVKDDPFFSGAEVVTAKALELLAAASGPRQFFWLHYFDPHSPYGDSNDGPTTTPQAVLNVAKAGEDPAQALARARQLYDIDVAHLDRSLGQLLARLAEEEDEIETHVLLVADHGESFGEEGSVAHGRRLIPSQIHVPCLLKSPRSAAGVRRDVAGSVDIAATLLSLAGLEPPAARSAAEGGRDLTQPPPARPLAFGMRRTYEQPFRDVRLDGSVHVLDDQLFFLVDDQGLLFRGNGEEVLLPVGEAGDSAEERLEHLRGVFAAFERSLENSGAEALTDPEVEKGLRALGYVG